MGGRLTLVGIVETPEGGRQAIIRTDGVTGVQIYVVGAMLGGWKLTTIKSAEIVLSARAETRAFKLFGDEDVSGVPRDVREEKEPVPKPLQEPTSQRVKSR